jgi:hypothetical protein
MVRTAISFSRNTAETASNSLIPVSAGEDDHADATAELSLTQINDESRPSANRYCEAELF